MSRSLFVALLFGSLAGMTSAAEPRPGDVLVRVNGEAITRADLEFEFVTANVPEERREAVEKTYLEALVDSRLMAGFLRKRKAKADPAAVREQVDRIRRSIARGERDPDEVLREFGYTAATLREKLALSLAWEAYSRRAVRPADVQAYWEKFKPRFDGTQVRASQILLGPPDETSAARSLDEEQATLAGLRKRIDAGDLDFAAAAQEHSVAPTAAKGGDVGWFPYRGKMPVSFTEHVFALPQLEAGAMTEPFDSPFGVHLVRVTDVKPGTYSLEDVRETVFDALADEVRAGLIAKEREAAKIDWATPE